MILRFFRKYFIRFICVFFPSSKHRKKIRDYFSDSAFERNPNATFEYPCYVTKDVVIEDGCKIGRYSYLSRGMVGGGTSIGRFCSFAADCKIAIGQHPIHFLSTHPFQYTNIKFITQDDGDFPYIEGCNFRKPTVICNDVWLGSNVIIMDGVTIGDGSVVAAGAVVTKDVPPYAIVGGVPAKIIKYRFSEDIIKRLLKTQWWNLSLEELKGVPFDDIEKALEVLEKRIK